MGWLFGKKKKVPKVPFPEGKPVDGALKFPDSPPSGKVIEPSAVKQAVGFDTSAGLPTDSDMPAEPAMEGQMSMPPMPSDDMARTPPPARVVAPATAPQVESMPGSSYDEEGPLFVKVDVYQRILGELDTLKKDAAHLKETQAKLEESEYNEEASFERLRKNMKVIHDQLLQVDRVLFKPQEGYR